MKALSYLVSLTMAICGLVSIELPASVTAADVSQTREVSSRLTAGPEAATQSNTEEKPKGSGTLTIANEYGGGVYYLTIERGSKGGPVRIPASSRAQPVKRLEEGKMYGTTVLIADGGSKSYSLEAGSYYVTLNFHKQGRGVYTMTEPPIVITAGQTRTLTITADGTLNY